MGRRPLCRREEDNWLAPDQDTFDFSGDHVVQINPGIAGLVPWITIGKRKSLIDTKRAFPLSEIQQLLQLQAVGDGRIFPIIAFPRFLALGANELIDQRHKTRVVVSVFRARPVAAIDETILTETLPQNI